MMSDFRLAWRQLRKAPGFTIVAVLSLALGIGLNTAIFSLVNEILLRSLPVKNPEELVLFRQIEGAGGRMASSEEGNSNKDAATGRSTGTSFSLLALARFRALPESGLAEVFAFAPLYQNNVLIDGQPESSVSGQLVSGNYHAALGVPMAAGRALTLADDQAGSIPVAVISHRYWTRRFDRDPAVVGKNILLNKVPVAIVGVTAEGFHGTQQVGDSPDISAPLAHHILFQPDRPEKAQPSYWWVRLMGRMAPGVSAPQVRARLEPVFQEVARAGLQQARALGDPGAVAPRDPPSLAVDVGGRGENDNRRYYAPSLRILMGLVSLVLLAACANVANLLLARATARRGEIAVRLALGASRARIVGQLLAESLLLAGVGAVLGVLAAHWGRDLLVAMRPLGRTLLMELPLDFRVLAFAVGVAVLTALVFGLAPALQATRLDLASEFQGGSRTLGGRRSRLSQALMVVQIALSLVLLVSTGLFVRTLQNLKAVDSGFDHHGLTLFRVDLGVAGYTPDRVAALGVRLQARLLQVPGVTAATYADMALLNQGRNSRGASLPGAADESAISVHALAVAENFFATMRLPLVAGRGFEARDDAAAAQVAVVNRAFAQKLFGDENPVGRRFRFGRGPQASLVEIVGVARDAKYATLRAAAPITVYLPIAQLPGNTLNFTLRTTGSLATIAPALHAALREIDSTLPVLNLRTQEQQLDRNHAQELLFARFSGLFGGLTLALACVGLYGLFSYNVLRRRGEIGLRMVLGALPGNVLRMIVREALALVAVGVLLGVAGAWAASRLIAAMLYGLSATDPAIYAAVALVLVAVAVVASLLPAWRAARIQPMQALRTEA